MININFTVRDKQIQFMSNSATSVNFFVPKLKGNPHLDSFAHCISPGMIVCKKFLKLGYFLANLKSFLYVVDIKSNHCYRANTRTCKMTKKQLTSYTLQQG